MTLLDRFHEEYESNGDIVLFRCKECGHTSMSLGYFHAHVEKHRGRGPFNMLIWPWNIGDFDALMEYTEVLRVDETDEIMLNEVDNL